MGKNFKHRYMFEKVHGHEDFEEEVDVEVDGDFDDDLDNNIEEDENEGELVEYIPPQTTTHNFATRYSIGSMLDPSDIERITKSMLDSPDKDTELDVPGRYYKVETMINEFKKHGYTTVKYNNFEYTKKDIFDNCVVLSRGYEPTEMSHYLSFSCFVLLPINNVTKKQIYFQVRVNDLPYFEVCYEYRYIYHYFNFFEQSYNNLCEHLIMKLFQLKEHKLMPSKIRSVKLQNCYSKFYNYSIRKR
jgi:hypothetical protein